MTQLPARASLLLAAVVQRNPSDHGPSSKGPRAEALAYHVDAPFPLGRVKGRSKKIFGPLRLPDNRCFLALVVALLAAV